MVSKTWLVALTFCLYVKNWNSKKREEQLISMLNVFPDINYASDNATFSKSDTVSFENICFGVFFVALPINYILNNPCSLI